MKPIRILFATCALMLPTGALVAGCGDDDDGGGEDPQAVLDQTFGNETSVSSGNLTISFNASAGGEQGGSIEGSITGPFQSDPETPSIPQLDWTGSLSGGGAGQEISFEGGLVITEDNAYVEYNDTAYEIGADQFAQITESFEQQAGAVEADQSLGFTEACSQALEQAGATDTSACDIDLSGWLTNLTNEGTEDVGGSESVHLSGDADVEQILTDIGGLASVVPGAASSAGFDPSQLSAFSDAVTEASIDVYSTVDENLLSKLDVALTIDPSAVAGGAAIPIESVDVGFGIEFADINDEQTIEAPADAQPITGLLEDAGINLGDLGGLGQIPGVGTELPGGSGGGGGGGGGGAAAATDAYLECLSQAQTADEINACAEEL